MESQPPTLVWLRRDLRLNDHAAFAKALEAGGKVQPVFIFDTDILARFKMKNDRRLTFLMARLRHLHQQLQEEGGGLLIFHGRPMEIPKLAALLGAPRVVAAEDFEPATRARDERVAAECRLDLVRDHLIFHPADVVKKDGDPFKVFTPYSRAWRAALTPAHLHEKKVTLKSRLADYSAISHQLGNQFTQLNPSDSLESLLAQIGYEKADLGEWGIDDEQTRLKSFIANRLKTYDQGRDALAAAGTSKLSPYLRFGFISPRACAAAAREHPSKGSDVWLNELIWREFYAAILYHFPIVAEQEFQEKYRSLNWQTSQNHFKAWQEGETGYPVVDAAMRQLRDTGWMHNRARMITASFLTKDLHIDWRLGEEHFAQYLMDYELASNNGGWQWAASVGTDAQPYFRIFNPELQSKRFDAEGDYIRRYVPALSKLGSKQIHNPHDKNDLFSAVHYPRPIVDHRAAKDRALAMFKAAG